MLRCAPTSSQWWRRSEGLATHRLAAPLLAHTRDACFQRVHISTMKTSQVAQA